MKIVTCIVKQVGYHAKMKRVRLTSESEFVGLTTPMDDWNFQISSIWPRVRSASRPFRMETQCFFLMFSHVPLFTFLNDFFIVQFYAHCSQRASQRAAMEFACRNEVPMMQPPTAAAAASVTPAFVRSEVSEVSLRAPLSFVRKFP